MITFPESFDDLDVSTGSVVRAGGTDLQQRIRAGSITGDIVDLTDIENFAGIATGASGTRIGAGTRMATVATQLAGLYPALAATTGGLATPQVRAQGTIGGNLVQRTRCWYYRHPDLDCFKSGGDSCPARTGRHLYGVAFDRSDCVHPHPSSIAMALLCHDDAEVELANGLRRSIPELLGDGTDPTRDHQLAADDVIAAVHLEPPWPEERGAYFRSISRFEAEWPLVECAVRASMLGEEIQQIAVAIGGVATVPLRMDRAESQMVGSVLDKATIEAASAACAAGTNPLPETSYKTDLIKATVRECLQRVLETGREF